MQCQLQLQKVAALPGETRLPRSSPGHDLGTGESTHAGQQLPATHPQPQSQLTCSTQHNYIARDAVKSPRLGTLHQDRYLFKIHLARNRERIVVAVKSTAGCGPPSQGPPRRLQAWTSPQAQATRPSLGKAQWLQWRLQVARLPTGRLRGARRPSGRP